MAGRHPDYGNKRPLGKQKRNVQTLGVYAFLPRLRGLLKRKRAAAKREWGGQGIHLFWGGGQICSQLAQETLDVPRTKGSWLPSPKAPLPSLPLFLAGYRPTRQ